MDALISSVNKKFVVLIILFLTLLFTPFNITFAQLTVSGKISDPNFNPVANATVEIFDQIDTLKNYTTITDASGYFVISNITNIENYTSNVPNEYLVIKNYPNPFNPSTIIYFEIPKAENIEIKIFDILGREIRSLFSGFHDAGVDQINWDGKNNFNQPVSAGIYLCQLKTKDHFNVHKMVLLDGGTNSTVSISYNKLSNQNIQKPAEVNSRFNFTVKVTGDSLDATYFRNLICTKDTTLNLIVSKIIQTKTIGIDGGIVGNDDFKLTIPAGAFDGNYNISLIKVEDDGAFGENTVTPSFKLSGIPNNYSKPLKIIAKYSGELTENSFLSVGVIAIDLIEESSSKVYNMHEASDSLGYLISTIPVSMSINKLLKTNEETNLDFFPVFATGYAITDSDHFKFVFPISAIQHILNLKEMFEAAYFIVEDGLQQLFIEETDRLVIVMPNAKPITYYTSSSVKGEDRSIQVFNVNQNSLSNNEYYNLQVKATQELYFFTGTRKEFTSDNEEAVFERKEWIWLAIYCWIEDLVSGDPDYKYPQKFLQEGMESFEGFNKNIPKDENPIHHGRGMSSVIKYLINKENFGLAGIGNFHKNIKTPGTIIKDFLESIDLPLNEWWPEYFKQLVSNELFELPNDYFINRAHDEWNINSAEDISKTFTNAEVGSYQDLSAKIFKINLNYSDLDKTQKLKFNIIGPENNKGLSLVLFSNKENQLEYIGTSNEVGVELQDLKGYFDLGINQFLAVLVNSNITQEDYLGESNINLTVEVTPKIIISDFDLTSTKCIATIAIYANLDVETGGSTENKTEQLIFSSEHAIGSFEGNTYTGSYYREGYNEGSYFSGEITVTLNEAHDSIIYASFTGLDEDPYWAIRWEKGFAAEDIPINPYENNVFNFQYGNTDNVCKSILNVNYYLKQSSVTTYIDHTCNEFSNVSFRFSKE